MLQYYAIYQGKQTGEQSGSKKNLFYVSPRHTSWVGKAMLLPTPPKLDIKKESLRNAFSSQYFKFY